MENTIKIHGFTVFSMAQHCLHLGEAAALRFHRAGSHQARQQGQADVETHRAEQQMGRTQSERPGGPTPEIL